MIGTPSVIANYIHTAIIKVYKSNITKRTGGKWSSEWLGKRLKTVIRSDYSPGSMDSDRQKNQISRLILRIVFEKYP